MHVQRDDPKLIRYLNETEILLHSSTSGVPGIAKRKQSRRPEYAPIPGLENVKKYPSGWADVGTSIAGGFMYCVYCALALICRRIEASIKPPHPTRRTELQQSRLPMGCINDLNNNKTNKIVNNLRQ